MKRRSGGTDDDPARDWAPPDDTAVDLDASDLPELEGDAATPPRGLETLPGYDLGVRAGRMAFFEQWGDLIAEIDRRGAARVLHAVRDHLLADGATPDVADAIVQSLAKRAGVKLV